MSHSEIFAEIDTRIRWKGLLAPKRQHWRIALISCVGIFVLITLLASLRASFALPWQSLLVPNFNDARLIALTFFAIAVQPAVAMGVLVLWATWYLLAAGILLSLAPAIAYLGLLWIGCRQWGVLMLIRAFPGLSSRDRFCVYPMAALLFFTIAPIISLSLLAANSLHSATLLGAAALWMFSGVYARSRHTALVLPTQKQEESSHVEQFLNASLLLLVLLSAMYYLHPTPLAGDSNKAYLAFPWYYAAENTLLLEDQAWVRNVMSAYHHTQEMLLAAGYALSGKIGMKIFALAVLLLKFQAVYLVCRSVFGFSRVTAKLLLICFSLLPIVTELHSIVRPENSLTILGLYFFYFAEQAVVERRIDRQEGTSWLAPFFVANLCICLAVSVKITGMYFGAAALAVYWREYLAAARSILKLRFMHWAVVALSVAYLSLWFVRNFYQFGTLGNSSPFGKYHLTIHFPPIRSFDVAWDFLHKGLVATDLYTEFPHFGYGLWGMVLIPSLLLALTTTGVVRRAAAVSGVFLFALLSCTTQIRYLAPVVPFLLVCSFSLFHSLKFRLPKNLAIAGVFVFLILQAIISFSVNTRTALARTLYERLPLPTSQEEFQKFPEPFASLNEVLEYRDRILSTYMDWNFTVNGILFRGDPIRSFADLVKLQQDNSFSYWLYFSYNATQSYNYFFNDELFLQSLAQPVRTKTFPLDYRRHVSLLRVDEKLFERVVQYVQAQDWDLSKTLIGSKQLKQQFPFSVRLGEQLQIAGLKHPLYRIAAHFPDNQPRFIVQHDSPKSVEGAPLAYYLEDKPEAVGPKPLTVLRSETGMASEGPAGTPAEDGIPASLTYSLWVPEFPDNSPIMLELYARGNPGAPAQAPRFSILSEGEVQQEGIVTLKAGDEFAAVSQVPVAPGSQVELVFSLLSEGQTEAVSLRDIRLVLAKQTNPPEFLLAKPAREQRPHPLFFELGTPLRTDVLPVWIYERFSGAMMRARALRLQTKRSNVIARDIAGFGRAMTLSAGNARGSKTYVVVLPAELHSDALVKLYLGKLQIAEGDAIRVRVRDPHANSKTALDAPLEGVYFSTVFRSSTEETLKPIAEVRIPYVASPERSLAGKPAFDKQVEIEVELLNPSGEPIGVSELMIIVGKG